MLDFIENDRSDLKNFQLLNSLLDQIRCVAFFQHAALKASNDAQRHRSLTWLYRTGRTDHWLDDLALLDLLGVLRYPTNNRFGLANPSTAKHRKNQSFSPQRLFNHFAT